MATIDDVYNILLRSGNMSNTTFSPFLYMWGSFLQQFGTNGMRDIGNAVFNIEGNVTTGPTQDKLDEIIARLQTIQDKVDTLLDTLNGGTIDTKIGIIITTTSDIQDKVEVLGVQGDDWNNGEHTIFGSVNAIGGSN